MTRQCSGWRQPDRNKAVSGYPHREVSGSHGYHNRMEQKIPDNAHIYRPSQRARMFFAILGCLASIAGIWLLAMSIPSYVAAIREGSSRTATVMAFLMVAIGSFMLVQGIAIFRSYWKRMLVLTSDAVMVEFLYGLKSIKFADILGRRSRATQYGSCTRIVPKAKSLPKITIKEGYIVDDIFRRWLALLPDLDAADKEKRRAAGKLHFWES